MKKSLRDRMIALARLGNRLARDVAGNTLAIVAAAIIPLAALIGGGVDMSRAYMAQSRLQLACDAAALAGRRAMTTGAVDSTVRSEALKFFRFNFPTGESSSTTPPYGVASFTPVVADGDDSAVVVTASTTVPTTLMGIFGYSSIPVSVNCNAKQDFVNTDVMLVLDNTGSMNCLSSDSASTYCATEKTGSKMSDLRDAVMSLYNTLVPTQTLLASHGLRLRYGIVPYSMTVNVGKLLPASYLKSDTWDYQSRQYAWDGITYNSNTVNGTWATTSSTATAWTQYNYYGADSKTNNQCNNAVPSDATSNGSATTTGSSSSTDSSNVITTLTNQQRTQTVTQYQGVWGISDTSGSQRDCRIDVRTVTNTQQRTNTQTQTPAYTLTYKQVTYDISQYVQSTSNVTFPLGNGSSGTSAPWAGCIEERKSSSATITSSTTDIPSDALDLNLNSVPTSDPDTKWKPYWPDVSYYRTANSSSATSGYATQDACPAQVSRLKPWDSTTLQSYLNSLVATGGTYSDIGMAWGGRLLSQTGIFASDNPATYGNMPVARYLILMTDGYIDTGGTTYNAWGVEQNDRRVSGAPYPGDTTDTANHMQRFSLLCSAVKNMGVQIYVIAFGAGVTGGLDSTLLHCATDENKAKAVADKTALINQFTQIGKDIGALRLTK